MILVLLTFRIFFFIPGDVTGDLLSFTLVIRPLSLLFPNRSESGKLVIRTDARNFRPDGVGVNSMFEGFLEIVEKLEALHTLF